MTTSEPTLPLTSSGAAEQEQSERPLLTAMYWAGTVAVFFAPSPIMLTTQLWGILAGYRLAAINSTAARRGDPDTSRHMFGPPRVTPNRERSALTSVFEYGLAMLDVWSSVDFWTSPY